ncbi:filamin-A-interacting protein 1 [Lucilia cuprina]|uniref:filamin-A-interacting protein 1 n=1 Tax=Lucilia cuprina TaxID=7375 RepID=UPI001F064C33|nr:filamin-A-interacting protein 1 [Lucilia cuprina]
MLTKEDVDSWNKLFPDCQINKTNLSNPTEHFLTNALVSYLRHFGINIEPPFNLQAENKENNRETRLFLITLARQIDHFLKITDKAYSFTYYDLIRPTPKKTAHMLYILLNYYYYYNLYKENVFKMAGDRINQLEELMGMVDDKRRDNEIRREENKNMKSTIENLMEEVPIARNKYRELEIKRNQQDEEIRKLRDTCKELKEKLEHLEDQKKILRKRVVADDESDELHKQLQQLKSEIAEQKEIEISNATNLNECKESYEKFQKLSKEIEQAQEIIPLRLIKQVQETNKLLTRAVKDDHDLQLKHDNLLQEIEDENHTKCSLEEEKQYKKQEFETKQNEHLKINNAKENVLKQRNTQLLQLQEEEHIFECQLEEQKEIAQYLRENISEILEPYEE